MTQPRSTSSPADALGATIANQSSRLSALETVAHRHDTDDGRFVRIIGDTMTGPLRNENSAGGTGRMASIPSANTDGDGGLYTGTTVDSLLVGTDQSTNLHLGANRVLGLTIEPSGSTYVNGPAYGLNIAGQMVGTSRIITTNRLQGMSFAVGSNVQATIFNFNINTTGIRHNHIIVWYQFSCYIDAAYAIKGRVIIGGTFYDSNYFSNEGSSHKEFSMYVAKNQTEGTINIQGACYAIGGAIRADINDSASIVVAVG